MSTNDIDDNFDLSILDKDMSDVEDLPSFEVWPTGTYKFLVNAKTKKFEGKEGKADRSVVMLEYEMVEAIEVKSNEVPIPGSRFSEMFGLDNEDGIKFLKRGLLPYSQFFETSNIKTLVTEKIQNVVATGTVKQRKVKGKDGADDAVYGSMTNVVIA